MVTGASWQAPCCRCLYRRYNNLTNKSFLGPLSLGELFKIDFVADEFRSHGLSSSAKGILSSCRSHYALHVDFKELAPFWNCDKTSIYHIALVRRHILIAQYDLRLCGLNSVVRGNRCTAWKAKPAFHMAARVERSELTLHFALMHHRSGSSPLPLIDWPTSEDRSRIFMQRGLILEQLITQTSYHNEAPS